MESQNPREGLDRSRIARAIRLSGLLAVVLGLGFASFYYLIRPQAPQPPPSELPVTVSSQRLDFGRLVIDDSVTRQLVLRNDGPEPLLARLSLAGDGYELTQNSVTLHPGLGTRILVTAKTGRAGSLQGELRISVDGDVSAPVVVALAGEVLTEADATATAAARTSRLLPLPVGTPLGSSMEFVAVGPPGAPMTDAPMIASSSFGASGIVPGAVAPVEVASALAPGATANQQIPSGADGAQADGSGRSRRPGLVVKPFDPETSVPIVSIAEAAPRVSPEAKISAEDAKEARHLEGDVPGGEELPEELPEDVERDSPSDDADREPGRTNPTLTISSMSQVRILGSTNVFYPQEIALVGAESGGAIGLTQPIQFPIVPLALGESVLFSQAGAVAGTFNSGNGQVTLRLPLSIVDNDGRTATVEMTLTTGTVMARDESGNVLAMTGTPRQNGTGILKLVGLGKVPSDTTSSVSGFVSSFEILGRLDFGTKTTPSLRSGLQGN